MPFALCIRNSAICVSNSAIHLKFQNLIESNFEQLEKDIKGLRASERVKAILDLAKFVLPTLKATEVDLTTSNNFQPITIEWKSEKELK